MMKPSNIALVVHLLLKELGIPVTLNSIIEELGRHPEPTSMLAISDIFSYWSIPNAAYNVKFDELNQIPAPFIAFVRKKEFALVSEITEQYAVISDDQLKICKIGLEEFKNMYSGSIFIAEKDELSGEADFKKKNGSERISAARLPLIYSTILVLSSFFYVYHPNYLPFFDFRNGILLCLKTLGLIATVLLLIQSIDNDNALIRKLCGGDNKQDCNAILSSDAAKLTSWLSWSEIGFIYFAGSFLVLFLNSTDETLIAALSLINICCLPYTLFSIYYQWRIAKKWCVFCCTVQAILWAEFITFTPHLLSINFFYIGIRDLFDIMICFAIPTLIWALIKPYLKIEKQIEPIKSELQRFKSNMGLFHKLLQEETYHPLPDDDDTLVVGNRESEKIITIVSNPICNPCAQAHKKLDEWLETRSDIKLQIVFTTHESDEDLKNKVATQLLTIAATQEESKLKNAMRDWYSWKYKTFENWSSKYPIEKLSLNERLKRQRDWCNLVGVTGTPALFINGRRLPSSYQIEDIRYFI